MRVVRLIASTLVLALLLLPLGACRSPIGAAAAETGGDGDQRATRIEPEISPTDSAAGPAPLPLPIPQGDDHESLSHFGILTPVFQGVGADALRSRCDPNDFYGGCL